MNSQMLHTHTQPNKLQIETVLNVPSDGRKKISTESLANTWLEKKIDMIGEKKRIFAIYEYGIYVCTKQMLCQLPTR